MPHQLTGAVQHYDWGDPTFIPDLIGEPRDGTPWAELWFGTHHSAPAHVRRGDQLAPLSSLTGEMTMLVKVLACSDPLSLQTHPTIERAREGYLREERAGVARSDPGRLYRDESDKPEMIVALTPFEALCGFAPMGDSVEFLSSLKWTAESKVLAERGLDGYLRWAFNQTSPPDTGSCPEWLERIATKYPNDPGLRVAPLLNYVLLSPGEALALPAGNLHAYLHGAGLEVMKSSDNVVRAGFTTKRIDVEELLAIVDTRPLVDPIARPIGEGPWLHYPSPTTAFSVANWSWSHGDVLVPSDSIRLVLGHHGLFEDQSAFAAVIVLPGEALTATVPPDSPTDGSWWVCTQR